MSKSSDYAQLSYSALKKLAKERGIEVPSSAKKPRIIHLLKENDAVSKKPERRPLAKKMPATDQEKLPFQQVKLKKVVGQPSAQKPKLPPRQPAQKQSKVGALKNMYNRKDKEVAKSQSGYIGIITVKKERRKSFSGRMKKKFDNTMSRKGSKDDLDLPSTNRWKKKTKRKKSIVRRDVPTKKPKLFTDVKLKSTKSPLKKISFEERSFFEEDDVRDEFSEPAPKFQGFRNRLRHVSKAKAQLRRSGSRANILEARSNLIPAKAKPKARSAFISQKRKLKTRQRSHSDLTDRKPRERLKPVSERNPKSGRAPALPPRPVSDFRAHLKHVSPKQVQIGSRRRSKSDPPSPKIQSKFPFNDVAKNASAPVKPARKTAHSSDHRSKLRHISPKMVKMKNRTRSNSDPSSPTKNQTIFGARKTRGRQRSASAESSMETLPKAGNTLKKKVSYNSKGQVSPALPPRNPVAVVPSLVLESKKLSSMHQKKLSEVPTIRMEKKPSTKPPRLPNAPSFQKLSSKPPPMPDGPSLQVDDRLLFLGDERSLGGEDIPDSPISGLKFQSQADLYVSPPKRPPINPIAVKKIKAKSAFLTKSKSLANAKPSLPKRAVDDSFAKVQTAPASNVNRPPLPKRNDSFWKIPRKRKIPINNRAPPPVPAPTPPHRHTVQAKSNLPSRISIKSAYSEIKGSVLNRKSKKFRLGDMQRRLPPSFRNDEDTSNFPDAPKSAFKGFKYSEGNLMPGDLPSSIYDISASWLNQRLGESLRLQFQPVQQVIIRDPGPYSEHEYCYILDLIYDRDWYPRSLFVKLCSFAAADGAMKAQFVNEVRFFKKIYPCLQINERVIPECFYAKYNEDGGILILQNLTETNFSIVSSDICMKLKDIETLMQFLANLHGEHQIGALEDLSYEPNIQECPMKFYNDVMIEHKQSHMVAMIEKFKRTFLNKREHKEFVEFFPEDIWDILEKMKKKDIYAFLAKSPISLCHGNVLHDNMFFNDKGEINICDWQNTHYGFPMYDLVQFLINQNGPYREGGYLNLGMERQIIAFCKKLVGIYFLSLSQTSGCFYNSLTECWKGFQVGTLVAFERVFSKHTLAKTSYTSDFHAQNEILVVLWLISSCKSILALTKKQKPGSQIFKSSTGIPFKNGVGLSSSMFRTL